MEGEREGEREGEGVADREARMQHLHLESKTRQAAFETPPVSAKEQWQ